jgi:hypothetical protein
MGLGLPLILAIIPSYTLDGIAYRVQDLKKPAIRLIGVGDLRPNLKSSDRRKGPMVV